MTPPRRMLEVGVEGDLFNDHAECPTCVEQGCVPVAEQGRVPVAPPFVPPDTRLHDAAQAAVVAWQDRRIEHPSVLEDAMQALTLVLLEEDTP